MSVIYRIMAKPPESNWRISHSDVEPTTPSAEAWDRPADDAPSSSGSPVLRWLLFLVFCGLVGAGIRYFTSWF
jgi:hypothetical protein